MKLPSPRLCDPISRWCLYRSYIHHCIYIARSSLTVLVNITFFSPGKSPLGMSVQSGADGDKAIQNDTSTEDKDALQLVIRHSRHWGDLGGMMR